MKALKWIGIILVVGIVAGQLLPDQADSTTTESSPAITTFNIVNHFEDISKKFYQCEAIVTIADTASLTRIEAELIRLAKKETCGLLHAYQSGEGIKYEESGSFAAAHPEHAADFIGEVNRAENTIRWNQEFLDTYK